MIPLVLLFASVATAPTYDIPAFCKPSGARDKLSFNACDAELRSRASLVHDWLTYPRKIRDECVGVENVAPVAGYTELKVCIEIAMPPDRGDAVKPR